MTASRSARVDAALVRAERSTRRPQRREPVAPLVTFDAAREEYARECAEANGRAPSGKPWAVRPRAGECCKPVDERDEHLVAWPCCRVAGHEGPCDAIPFGGAP